eukprot:8760897-Alexandrium_andersonii.AAC.1
MNNARSSNSICVHGATPRSASSAHACRLRRQRPRKRPQHWPPELPSSALCTVLRAESDGDNVPKTCRTPTRG